MGDVGQTKTTGGATTAAWCADKERGLRCPGHDDQSAFSLVLMCLWESTVCGNGVEPREASSRRRSHLTPHAARPISRRKR